MSKNIIKSFNEIPGPKTLPLIGTLFHYLPIVGKYRFDNLCQNGIKKYLEFGPVVKEEIVPGTNIVWIFTPEDIQELFRKEGKHPQRRSHLALKHYRNQRQDLYNSGGLLPTNGHEWYRLRSAFQKGLSSPQNVKSYLSQINDAVDSFLSHITHHYHFQMDFLPKLSRIFLEILGLVAFDYKLNSFTEEELKPESKSSRLMESALTINSCIFKTDNGLQLWRFWETPLFNKLKRAHQYMEEIAVELIDNKIQNIKDKNQRKNSVLEFYLSSSECDIKDITGMCADMLLAGMDTVGIYISYTTSFILYHLATNKEKQEKLFNESIKLLPNCNSAVTSEILANAEYLKAVLKESFRMNPISVGIGRILSEDAIFSGYHVPKGNVVVTQNEATCKLTDYFPEPWKFIPERWLRIQQKQTINPYLVLPFGHGPRTCIARRLAEQNMQTLILKLCRNFNIEWMGKILGTKSNLINMPDSPLNFAFKPRK